MWATLKTYFHTFLLVQVSAGSETNHLITLIPIYALELMAAVWEVFGQKKESFISTYIYIFSVVRVWCQLIFVSQCAMTCCTVLVKQRYVQRYFLLTLSTTMTLSLSKVVIVWSLKETTTEPFYWNVSHILCMLWESIIKRLSADYERCNKQRKTKHYKNNTFNVSQRRLHRQCHTVGTKSRVNNTFHIWGPYSVL